MFVFGVKESNCKVSFLICGEHITVLSQNTLQTTFGNLRVCSPILWERHYLASVVVKSVMRNIKQKALFFSNLIHNLNAPFAVFCLFRLCEPWSLCAQERKCQFVSKLSACVVLPGKDIRNIFFLLGRFLSSLGHLICFF